jgi:hypothetical protein
VLALQAFNPTQHFAGAQAINQEEGPPQEGWKSQTVDGPDVSVPGALQDAIAQTMDGLIDHRKQTALKETAFFEKSVRDGALFGRLFQAQIRIDGWVDGSKS